MRCFECRYLDRSKVLTCYPPKYYCTYDNTTHFTDDECKYEHYPIVRCKDCEYWHNDYMGDWCSKVSGMSPRWTKADDFCSWAKMKDDEVKDI